MSNPVLLRSPIKTTFSPAQVYTLVDSIVKKLYSGIAMTLPIGLTVKKIESAISASAGIVGMARRRLKLTPQQWAEVIKRWPHLTEFIQDVSELMIDQAEAHVYNKITDGEDTKLLQWFLDRKGKNRGYTTRNEVTGKDDEPLDLSFSIKIIEPNKEEKTEEPDNAKN